MLDIPSVCYNIASITITVFATSILGDGPTSVLEISEYAWLKFCNLIVEIESSAK
jgi:hypothetical protein